ncbi:MAG: aldo/keto reductase [Bradyrhizobium sp.]|nr:MAG: aldo/keto reductase [Bradyrhizobium sp.]
MKISDRRRVTRSGLEVTLLGLGGAAFGGLYSQVSAADALAAMRAAWGAGVRYFDSAPMYGLGRAELLLGHFLREDGEDGAGATVSTKVGRLIAGERHTRDGVAGAPSNPFAPEWRDGLKFTEVFDYSYDAILRSFDDSQQRLGRPGIDLLFVHDIGRATHAERHDFHWRALTSGGGFRALEELRAAGLIKGFGLGVNETDIIHDAMNESDLDCCLLAGRYSLLDRSADALLSKARAQGVALVIGGVFNSGILAAGAGRERKFNYADAPAHIAARVDELARICAKFDVPLGAAALQFPLRDARVASILVGARSAAEVATNLEWFEHKIPAELWAAIDASG